MRVSMYVEYKSYIIVITHVCKCVYFYYNYMKSYVII